MTPCDDCALRLFNDKCHCLKGVGNPWSGKMIVVPNVDYQAYKNKDMTFSKYVEVINEVLTSSTGGLDYYIVPLIRCKLNENCPIDNHLIRRCGVYLFTEMRIYNINKILLLGRAAELITPNAISKDVNKMFIGPGTLGRVYSVSYSPLVKYIDDNKYKEFCNHLVKWFNADKYNNYDGFEIVKI